jgi:uncharacterized protein (DUF1501 family)
MTSKFDRREFLLSASAGLFAMGSSPLTWPRPGMGATRATAPTLLTIYLRGGNDALGTVIPYTNKMYYDVRPTISIGPETTPEEPGVVKLTDHYGLHPALGALKPLWDAKKLSAILNVGSPHPTRSHFDAQDFMEYASPGDRTMKQGWLNRFLAATKATGQSELRALALQGLLPRSLRGDHPVLAVPTLRQGESEGLLDLFDDVYRSGSGEMMDGGGDSRGREEAVAVGRHTIETLRRFWEVAEMNPDDDASDHYPKGQFGARLRLLARIIKKQVGLEVAALDVPGWDHHQGEGSTDGAIQRDLKNLGDGLAAFAADLGGALDRTLILVMTEFGRTVAENGNRGTDHGRGSMMLAIGGGVNGAKIFGDYGTLDPKELADGRDLPVQIDFRTVFHEALEGTFGYKAEKGFFPLWSPKEPLGLFRSAKAK